MFEATATMPGTPIDIMAGVSTKAPPDPMKPETRPPTKPTKSRKAILPTVRSMKLSALASIAGSYFDCLAWTPSTSQNMPVKAP